MYNSIDSTVNLPHSIISTFKMNKDINSIKISIIVPVYNCIDYLEACVLSITSQSHKNIEIILVNDGSSDGSYERCKKYAENDPRIIVLDKENGGVSSARNAGIKAASGDYIAFVDADDSADNDLCLKMLEKAISGNFPIVFCGYDFIIEKTGKSTPITFNCDDIYGTNALDRAYPALFNNRHILSVFGKLFNADIIRDNELRFHEDMSLGEDFIFLHEYFTLSEKAFARTGFPAGRNLSKDSKLTIDNNFPTDKNPPTRNNFPPDKDLPIGNDFPADNTFTIGIVNEPLYKYYIHAEKSLSKSAGLSRIKNTRMLFSKAKQLFTNLNIYDTGMRVISFYYMRSLSIVFNNATLTGGEMKTLLKDFSRFPETREALKFLGFRKPEAIAYQLSFRIRSTMFLKLTLWFRNAVIARRDGG